MLKVPKNFDWDYNESIDQLRENFHLNHIDYPNSMEHGMSIHLLRNSNCSQQRFIFFGVQVMLFFVKLTPNVFYSF